MYQLPVIEYNIVFGITYCILFEIDCICVSVIGFKMTALRKCSECHYYRGHLDFGHDACLDHRACHTRWGYDPTVYEVCRDNRKIWEPLSASTSGWRRELALHCRRLGGEDVWPFEAAFSSFFEVVLTTGSSSGSRSRDPSPRRGRGSRSATPLPRDRSPARSLASRRSRSPPWLRPPLLRSTCISRFLRS